MSPRASKLKTQFLFFAAALLTAGFSHGEAGDPTPGRSTPLEQTHFTQAKVAIIIDDLGYKLSLGKQSIALPHPVTLSIIPSSPHARTLALEANCQANKELIVHLPMTPEHEKDWEKGLNPHMNKDEFSREATRLLQSIPFALGANNHGGSLLTRDRQKMDWLMSILYQHALFFVDSRTTPHSVAKEAANFAKVQFSSRDVFLDNERNVEAISRQLDKLSRLALRHGKAVAIGHPHPETIQILREYLPKMKGLGIELVGISTLLNSPERKTDNALSSITAESRSLAPAPSTDHSI